MLDGRRIRDDETPQFLEMDQDDIIEVYQEQTGGMADSKWSSEPITVKVINRDLKPESQKLMEISFNIKTTTQLGLLKKAYAEKNGVQKSTLRFLFNKRRINDEETPKDFEMETYDTIDVYQGQI